MDSLNTTRVVTLVKAACDRRYATLKGNVQPVEVVKFPVTKGYLCVPIIIIIGR